jgi:hypothetical protein
MNSSIPAPKCGAESRLVLLKFSSTTIAARSGFVDRARERCVYSEEKAIAHTRSKMKMAPVVLGESRTKLMTI